MLTKTAFIWSKTLHYYEILLQFKRTVFYFKNVIYSYESKAVFNSVIVTRSFRNLSNMLILYSRSVPIIIHIENNPTMTHFFQYF